MESTPTSAFDNNELVSNEETSGWDEETSTTSGEGSSGWDEDLPNWGEEKVHTNNMEPNLVGGHRMVALHRFVGLDRPIFTLREDGENKDASGAFHHYEGILNENREKWSVLMEKTPEQKEIARVVMRELPIFLKKFGLEKPVKLPENVFKIFDMSGWSDEAREKARRSPAHWSTQDQLVRFNGDTIKNMSNLMFAKILAHELVHTQSFESLEVVETLDKDGKTIRSAENRRSGLVNYSREKGENGKITSIDNFAEINEAITESLSQRFIQANLSDIPHIEPDLEALKEKIKGIYEEEKQKNPDKSVHVQDNVTRFEYGDEETKEGINLVYDSGAYWKEIKYLKKSVKTVLKKAQEYQTDYAFSGAITVQKSLHDALMSFNEESDIFLFLTKVYFSGKQLELARLVEYVTGKDYREVGEMTNLVKKKYPERFK